MRRYVRFLDRFKYFIVTLVPLLVLLAGISLKDMAYEGGYRIWFAEGSPTLEEYDRFKRVFGSDDYIVIAFEEGEGVFTPKALQSIARITGALWQTPHIERVISLTSVPDIAVDPEFPDEVTVEAFIPDPGTLDAAQLADKRRRALENPLIRPLFVNGDATATMISAEVAVGARDAGNTSFEIRDAVREILDAEAERTGYRYRLGGAIPLQTGFIDVMVSELALFIPLLSAGVVLFLLVVYRRVSAIVVPMAVVGLTIIATLSAEVLSGEKINNFTADIPVFALAIGIATTVHLLTAWQMRLNRGAERFEAVAYALEKNLLPVFLAALTTAIGFGSLAVSEIVPVYTLGVTTAGAVMLVFLLSVFFMPAALLCVRKPLRREDESKHPLFAHYGRFIVSNTRAIISVTLLLFALLGAGLTQLRVDSNLINFLDRDVEVREATEFISERVTGPMSYEIVVDALKDEGIKEPAFMNAVERFSEAFAGEFGDVRHVGSLLDVVKRFHRVMHGDDPAYERVPGSREEIAQYLLLYSLSLPAGLEISDSVDVKERYLRVRAATNITYAQNDLRMISWAEGWWREHTPYRAKVYGQTSMFAKMQSDVTGTLLESIGISLLLISGVMLLVFRNPRLLHIYVLPTLLPFVLVLGAMGWMGIDVDLGVAISGAVILGIAVDDTMHFLVKYFHARKRGLGVEAALDEVMAYAGRAILITTMILSAAFLMLTASDFIPNVHFGIVTASALLIAVVVDLLLLPALLNLADRNR